MIADYGYDGGPVAQPGAIPARVVAAYGDYYRVVCDEGECIARKKAGAYHNRPDAIPPTTGDFVALKWNPHGEGRILATLPRKSRFDRLDPSSKRRQAQTIAVNFDTLFFLMSLNQNFSVRRLERFLAAGRTSSAPVVVLLTKRDLVDDDSLADYLAQARAHAGGAEVLAISSLTGAGLDQLARELGLWEADAGVADAFADVEALIGHCRFSDCQHVTEPGCAIKTALADGTLDVSRWEAYVRLKVESAGGEIARAASTHRYRK